MQDTAGHEIDKNIPVYGCEGCNTTPGRMGCYIHGSRTWTIVPTNKIYPYDPEFGFDIELLKAIDRANYGKMLTPIKLI